MSPSPLAEARITGRAGLRGGGWPISLVFSRSLSYCSFLADGVVGAPGPEETWQMQRFVKNCAIVRPVLDARVN